MAQANRNQPVAPFVAPNGDLPPAVLDFLRQPVANENDPVFAAIVRDVAERGEGRVMGAAAIRDRRRHADRVGGEVAETRRDLLVRLTAFMRDWSRSVALSNQVVKDEKSRQERDTDDSERRREIARRKRELRAVTQHYEEKKRLRNEKDSEGLLEWTTHCPTALLARETAANDSRVDRARQRNRVRVEDVSDEAQPDGQAESKEESKLDANAAPPRAAETGQLLLTAPAAAAEAAGLTAPPAARASISAVLALPPTASPAPAAASASAARDAGAAVPATPSVTDARAPAATKAKSAAPSAAPANAARAAPVPPPGAKRAATRAGQATAQNSAQAQPSARNVAGAASTQPVPQRPPAAAALLLGSQGMDTAE